MTIETVKRVLNDHIGKEVEIKYNLGRNKYEKYRVIIKELYNYVFIVEVNKPVSQIKSFSYSDVINRTIRIHF